jgi:hypothetical protein
MKIENFIDNPDGSATITISEISIKEQKAFIQIGVLKSLMDYCYDVIDYNEEDITKEGKNSEG